MKRKLLLAALCVAGALGFKANAEDEDFTSYITNADLSSKEGWTLTQTTTDDKWSDVKGSSPSYVLEAYAGWGNLNMTAYSIKQNVTLPSGKYRAEGYAFYRYGLTYDVNPSISNAKFVAGDFSSKVVTLGSVTLDETLTGYPNSTGDASTAFTNGYYKSEIEFAIESESTIEFGYEGTHTLKQSWFIAGPIKLYRTGDFDYSLYQSQLESLVSDAKALQGQTMAASISTALNNVITTYDGQTCASVAAYNSAYTALNTAISNAETSIASYAIIAAGSIPDNSLTGWVCENTNTFHINTWSVEGNPGNDPSSMVTPFIENWVGKGSYLGAGKVYYQLAGLEPGEVYYAQALVRSYNEASSDAPNGPDFFINDVVTSLSTAGTTFTYNNMSGIYATLGGAATVGEDGILKLGVEIAEDRNYNWVAFKSVSIQSMDDAFDAAVAKVTALEGTIPTAAYNAAYAVVTDNSGDNYPTTAAGFETAIAAIEAAATSAAAMQKPYANWNTQKAIVEHNVATSTDNESARTTLSDALSTQSTAIENATTVEGINNVISALKTANYTYAQVATPTTEGDYIDCTTMLTNPDVTELSGNAGWKTEQEGGNFGVTTNAHRDGYATAYSIEYWSGTAQANDKFSLYDEVTLPAGTYEMSCYAFASPNGVDGATNNAVYFYANDTQGSLISSTDLEEATLSFVNASEQAVKIGLKTLTGNQYRWMGIGYVSLYKVPANAVTIDEDEDYTPESVAATVTLKRTIKANTWNTFVVPFQINNTELKAAFGDDVAVAEFSENSENADDVTVTFNTMETPAIAPNKPVLLKTSTAGSEYTFEGRTIATGETKVAGTNIDFVGTYAATTDIAEGDYFIASDKLYKSAGATTIAGTRAYLKAKTAGAKVRMIIDDEATGIEGIAADAVQNGKVYDLSGRLVKNPTKGLYIMNGKKYFVK